MSAWVSLVAHEVDWMHHTLELTQRLTRVLAHEAEHGCVPPDELEPERLSWFAFTRQRFPEHPWWEDPVDSMIVSPRNAGPA